MKPAIQVEGISKQYQLGTSHGGGYRTLREAITSGVKARWDRFQSLTDPLAGGPPGGQALWALKDVSFAVQPGDVVGIIGRNGAGKSTLLKVLSRITEPTSGRVVIRGRVGSLLEVGTGFHPELTGRENVYLNGSILGMTRNEIERNFDEIVAFAEIERFLDTPVKRYSSGMYVRLAFAVAAHLQLDILIVDEVLAVGDATYQRRCVKRMEELAREGRTILFVSHNLDLIPRLCGSAILMERGQVREVGPAKVVAERYLEDLSRVESQGELTTAFRVGDQRAKFSRVEVVRGGGGGTTFHPSGDDLILRVEVDACTELPDAALAINLRTLSGTKIHSAWTREQNYPVRLRPGTQSFYCTFRQVRFRPGMVFEIELWMDSNGIMDHIPHAMRMTVTDGNDTDRFSNSTDQGFVLNPVLWGTDISAE